MKRAVVVLFISLVIALGGAALWYQSNLSYEFKSSLKLEVQQGEGFFSVLQKLKKHESISVKSAKVYLKQKKLENALKPGEYFVEAGQTLKSVIKDLATGKVILYKVTIPEGYNLYEIAQTLEDKGILKDKQKFISYATRAGSYNKSLLKNHESLEGYLYPATYKFSKNMKVTDIVYEMTQSHLENYADVLKENSLPKGYTKHQIISLASVVEKETGASWERPIIASVFWNRLKKRMRLQSDPTTIYGQWVKTGERLFNIRKKHLLEKNEYNTYKISGIPVGPIANPGREAIEAVLNPKKTPYFYFVSKNDGTHYFSKTYKEHTEAVRRFQLSKKARSGKSWRDLKK